MENRVFIPRPAPSISINGHVFALKMGDTAIMERVEQVKSVCADMLEQKKGNMAAADVVAIGKQVEAAINDICGDNAMHTMIDGAVMRVREALQLLSVVAEEAGKAYISELIAANE